MNIGKECLIKRSSILPIHSYKELNFIKGSLGVCKIIYEDLDGKGYIGGTGFFIKFKRDRNDIEYQYFLMTCEHVITKTMIDLNNININIFYHYESIHKIIELNKKRYIKEYKTNYNVDITIIEIKEEDDISWVYFLEPDYDMNNGFDQYLGKKIVIHQYPLSNEQCYAKGIISNINKDDKIIIHKCSSEKGSSGSPIILEGSKFVLGIHFYRNINHYYYGDENYGYFIIDVLNDLDRINTVKYYKEKNKNVYNLTDREILAKKTHNERIYNIHNFRLSLFYDNVFSELKFSIENIGEKEIYVYFEVFDEKKIYNTFRCFDELIYKIEITERFSEFIIENKYEDNEILSIKKLKHNKKQNIGFHPNKQVSYKEELYSCEILINRKKKTISEFVDKIMNKEMVEINNSFQTLNINNEYYN